MALDPTGVPSRQDILDAIAAAVPQTEARNRLGFTDAGGRAYFGFLTPFEAPPIVVATGGNDEDVYVPPELVTTDGFTAQFRFRFVNALGTPQLLITNADVRVYYIATEETAP